MSDDKPKIGSSESTTQSTRIAPGKQAPVATTSGTAPITQPGNDSRHPPSTAGTSSPALSTEGAGSPPASHTAASFTLSARGENLGQFQPLQTGSVLKERFVLEEMLGRGGMGVVFKARDLRRIEAMDRDPFIAVKVLSGEFQRNPDSFIALQREAKKAQQLAHPNIVTVYDFDRDGPNVFMTMELLEGEPLDKVIRRRHPNTLPMQQALKIIEQMAQALAYAHQQEIVHSDFKPGNVFLTSKNIIKVVDFGISRAVQKPDTVLSDATVFDPGVLGALTPAYASCEMLECKPPDPSDDVYGLGVVAYELLTGSHPFDRKSATYARDIDLEPKRPKEWPRHLWSAISNALRFERERRTPDAARFLQEFSGTLRNGGGRMVNRSLLAAAGFALALSATGTLLYLQHADDTQEAQRPTLEETSLLPPELKTKVEKLLEVADVHQMVGRYLDPPGSNAYAAYQQILQLHPNNRQAVTGLQEMGHQIEMTARLRLQQGDVAGSRSLVEKGIAVFPEHPGLLALQRELESH